MRAEFVNAFLLSAEEVLNRVLGVEVHRGIIGRKDKNLPSFELAIVLGVRGELKGAVIFSMNEAVALSIASAMLNGFPLVNLNKLAESAILELANVITGQAVAKLYEETACKCDISVPVMIRRSQWGLLNNSMSALYVQIRTQLGTVELNVGVH